MELKLSHIDTSNAFAPEVWVKHSGKKVKKDRKLKLPREVVPALTEYVKTYAISEKLFPYTQRFLRYLLTSVGQQAGIHKRISGQLLRDTCAVRLLRHGEPMETVLKKLGLSDTTWEDAVNHHDRWPLFHHNHCHPLLSNRPNHELLTGKLNHLFGDHSEGIDLYKPFDLGK